ncbi:regucalcin-like [Salarias fasciatus]|uniref:Regucalcin n=1 Tax=Salarias fasciatus TaxID=181472 RepID=A0A672GVG4_SALFA|nr:regucalcin-like [Salarias fasciatus]
MSSVKVERAVNPGTLLGEGPVWEESDQKLLFVDIPGQKIHRWSPSTNQIESIATEDTVGFAVPRRSGGYVAGVGRSIVAVDWSTQKTTVLAKVDEDKPTNRLNDGKVDPVGRLLAGTMSKEDNPVEKKPGSLFSLTSDHKLTKLLGQVDISNGMDWSLDQKTMYYIDSLCLSVDAFDYDMVTGQMSNRRVVYRLKEDEGIPDGMTMDADGRLWVACYDGGRVLNIDPATGVRLQTISLPATKTTSVCFGGPDYTDLYVTSASLGLSESELKQQPDAGATFKVTGLGVKGRPAHSFAG